MKKLTVKAGFGIVLQFDGWLFAMLSSQVSNPGGYFERCATAVIADWRVKKVTPHIHFHTNKKINLKIDTAVGMALLEFIEYYPLPITDQLGNWLNKLSRDIHQYFQ